MKLRITGGTREQQRAVRKMAQWLDTQLLSPRVTRDVNVKIIIFAADSINTPSSTDWVDFEPPQKLPRDFVIKLNGSVPRRNLMLSLCHQMVRVKQLVKGELHAYREHPPKIRWKNKMYTNIHLALGTSTNLPWEVEAAGLEESLYHLFFREHDFDEVFINTVFVNVYLSLKDAPSQFLMCIEGQLVEEGWVEITEDSPIRYRKHQRTTLRHDITESNIETFHTKRIQVTTVPAADPGAVGAESSNTEEGSS